MKKLLVKLKILYKNVLIKTTLCSLVPLSKIQFNLINVL